MSTKKLDLTGLYPPITTPFNDDESIAWDKLKANMDKWNDTKLRGYLVQGSNGEAIHPAGAVGVVVHSPRDRNHSYRVRFPDGFDALLHHHNLMLLAEYKQGAINDSKTPLKLLPLLLWLCDIVLLCLLTKVPGFDTFIS